MYVLTLLLKKLTDSNYFSLPSTFYSICLILYFDTLVLRTCTFFQNVLLLQINYLTLFTIWCWLLKKVVFIIKQNIKCLQTVLTAGTILCVDSWTASSVMSADTSQPGPCHSRAIFKEDPYMWTQWKQLKCCNCPFERQLAIQWWVYFGLIVKFNQYSCWSNLFIYFYEHKYSDGLHSSRNML